MFSPKNLWRVLILCNGYFFSCLLLRHSLSSVCEVFRDGAWPKDVSRWQYQNSWKYSWLLLQWHTVMDEFIVVLPILCIVRMLKLLALDQDQERLVVLNTIPVSHAWLSCFRSPSLFLVCHLCHSQPMRPHGLHKLLGNFCELCRY